MSIIEENRDEYFLGSICHKIEGSNYIIIDGQQRLTTLFLLLKALYDISDDVKFKRKIKNQYLINEYEDDANKIKLKPTKKDAKVYNKLINWDEFDEKNFDDNEKLSNVYKNYMCMKSLLLKEFKKHNYLEQDIESAIGKLNVTEQKIDNENPQIIFENLNSKNKELSDSSLILNYLLMPLDYKTQELFYEKYWLPLEERIGSKNLSNFLTYYILMETKSSQIFLDGSMKTISNKNIYSVFKKHYYDVYKSKNAVEGLFKSLYKYSYYYEKCLYNKDSNLSNEIDRKLNDLFYRMNSLGEPSILIMYLYDKFASNLLSESVFLNILDILISYSFRCFVCRTNANKKKFYTDLVSKLDKVDSCENYLIEFSRLLLFAKGNDLFPSDELFLNSLKAENLFSVLDSHRCKYMLYQFEKSFNHKENIDYSNGSIEHIMPRKLTKDWESYLKSFNDLDNHEIVLNTLGNLALSGFNSEESNKLFEDKKYYYKKSNYYLTRSLCDNTKWTSEDIEKRTAELSLLALKIWKYPKISIDYKYNLNNDLSNFSKTKPISLFINNEVYKVNSWLDFITTAFKVYYSLDKKHLLDFLNFEGYSNRRGEELLGSVMKQDYINIELEEDLYFYFAKISEHTSTSLYLERLKCYLNYLDTYVKLKEDDSYINGLCFTVTYT